MNLDFDRDVYSEYEEWLNYHSGKALYVDGCRQVGKTYSIEKFCKKHFKNIYSLNLFDYSTLNKINCLLEDNTLRDSVDRFFNNFIDSEDSVLFIDEIQESPNVYNGIKTFLHDSKCRLIVSGSYLGSVLHDFKFKLPTGYIFGVTVHPLSFSEFTKVFGKYDLFMSVDLFGGSPREDYLELKELYDLYCTIGGMPGIVAESLCLDSSYKLDKFFSRLIELLTSEPDRYNDKFYDEGVFTNLFNYLCTFIIHNKNKSNINISEELQPLIFKDYHINVSKADITKTLYWFSNSRVIHFLDKYIDCNPSKIQFNQRMFFEDLGIFNYLCRHSNLNESEMLGELNENYVFNVLNKWRGGNFGFGSIPGGGYEIDFVTGVDVSSDIIGIEVKTGSKSGKSITEALKRGLINKAIYCMGDTFGGRNKNIDTIPIYLIERYDFNDQFKYSSNKYKDISPIKIFNKGRR